MMGSFSFDEFNNFRRTFNPSLWNEIRPDIWECGEVGYWNIKTKSQTAIYTENALWGRVRDFRRS